MWLREQSGIPARGIEAARAVAGRGLVGDHADGGKRQITLIDVASWRAACVELGQELDPALRRANVLISGLDLGSCIGKTLRLGDVRVAVLGETTPCALMEATEPGLLRALAPACRGGVYCQILDDGEIAIGDVVEVHGQNSFDTATPE